MADQTPDLIQRAAARLQQPATLSARSATTPGRDTADVVRVSPSTRFEPIGGGERAEPGIRPPGVSQRHVNVSPTSLALHGIALPSSGFSRTVEEFRALKRHVLSNASRARSAADAASGRIILVTSARPGEGKTFTATNLALALAYEKDARVLLMDADAYRQSLMSYLGISADTGWLDVISEPSPLLDLVTLGTNVPGLWVLPAGRERGEIPEIMSSRHMKKLLDLLKHRALNTRAIGGPGAVCRRGASDEPGRH
jgi:Mrp family chromosome partitioning ATPase